MTPDLLRAIRRTAEAQIERYDHELTDRPQSIELTDARRLWARLAYLADAQLQRQEHDDGGNRGSNLPAGK